MTTANYTHSAELNGTLDLDCQPVGTDVADLSVNVNTKDFWVEISTKHQSISIYAGDGTDLFLALNAIGGAFLNAAQEMHIDMHGSRAK